MGGKIKPRFVIFANHRISGIEQSNISILDMKKSIQRAIIAPFGRVLFFLLAQTLLSQEV
jgi:hypothetical protein